MATVFRPQKSYITEAALQSLQKTIADLEILSEADADEFGADG